ncbi:MAG: alanine dehydrogenase [Thermodesulfovibrionales bacterium]
MIIGVPKEIKTEEYRVAVTPAGAGELRHGGHTVLVETGAGSGSGFSDDDYLAEDADIVDRSTVFAKADLIVKVKEPLPSEFGLLREGVAVFTYLHLAPNRGLTDLLLEKRITGLAYETLEVSGDLPLLAPMSEIAGRIAPLVGSFYLQKPRGGPGLLPSGATGVRPAKTVILGAGVVGANAARISRGIGMETVVLNRGIDRLRKIDELFSGSVKTLPLTQENIGVEIRDADLVIGALLVPGGRTPVLISREMLSSMKQGSVIVDVAIDQGGCAETSRPTTHAEPVFTVDGITHYCVANMPGAFPRSSTLALANATLPYVKMIAESGIRRLPELDAIQSAINTLDGRIVHPVLREAMAGRQ